LAERDDIGIARLIQPMAALDKFGAKIAQMSHRSAKARKPQTEKNKQDFKK
jgi:hypothetical protein